MPCKAPTRLLLLGLAAALVLLWAPPPGVAAPPDLARGEGYASPEGSQPVREVQQLLRRLGDPPGPIDGLYGPLTEAAVMRFQEAHALIVDGVVGPQTWGRVIAERKRLHNAARKSPDRVNRAESARSQAPPQARPKLPPQGEPKPAQADSSSTVEAPIVGAVAGFALVLFGVVLWRLAGRRRGRESGTTGGTRASPRLGLVCAALLAAFVVGAASGAVFATQAAPDDHPETRAR